MKAGYRVLVIDDDDAVRGGIVRYLRVTGHEVLEASGGAEALRLASGGDLDAVITDINMPDTDGIEVILALAEQRPGLPVIAISGGGLMPKELLLSSAGILGAVQTLAKPFELAELREALERAVTGRSIPQTPVDREPVDPTI